MIDELRVLIDQHGQVSESVDAALARVEVTGVLPPDETLAQIGVSVLSESPSPLIATNLPALSAIASTLKRVAVPEYRTA